MSREITLNVNVLTLFYVKHDTRSQPFISRFISLHFHRYHRSFFHKKTVNRRRNLQYSCGAFVWTFQRPGGGSFYGPQLHNSCTNFPLASSLSLSHSPPGTGQEVQLTIFRVFSRYESFKIASRFSEAQMHDIFFLCLIISQCSPRSSSISRLNEGSSSSLDLMLSISFPT